MAAVRVLLIDHNDDLLEGFSAWLRMEPNVEIVGCAHSGLDAVELVERIRPDLLLMDVAIPDMSGFEATRRIKSRPGAPMVVLTTFHDSEAARAEAWAAGADDLIAQSEVTGRLRKLIRDLAAGRPPRRTDSRATEKRSKSTKQGPEGI